MIPTKLECKDLHKKYASSEKHFELCWRHCEIVAEIALSSADKKGLDVDKELLEAACLLHDVGSYMLMDEDANISGYYNLHAIFGSKILEEEGIDDRILKAVERHVQLGMTAEDYRKSGWKNPYKDYIPVTYVERLVNYADRFHSKVPVFNSYETICKKLEKHTPHKVEVFDDYIEEFGMPDLLALSKSYGHPIS